MSIAEYKSWVGTRARFFFALASPVSHGYPQGQLPPFFPPLEATHSWRNTSQRRPRDSHRSIAADGSPSKSSRQCRRQLVLLQAPPQVPEVSEVPEVPAASDSLGRVVAVELPQELQVSEPALYAFFAELLFCAKVVGQTGCKAARLSAF